jgi:hypothetical protein
MVEYRSAQVGAARRCAAALGYTLHCRDGLFGLVETKTTNKAMGFSLEGAPQASLQDVLAWLQDGPQGG